MTVSDAAPVRLSIEEGLACITLARPESGNGFDGPLSTALTEAVREVSGRDGVRCVLLSAEGPNFGVGGDINHMSTIEVGGHGTAFGELIDGGAPAFVGLHELTVPVVSAVRGWVIGASLGLASVADIVLASDTARFRAGFPGIGLPGDLGATWLLPQAIGMRRALSMLLEDFVVDAPTAVAWGLATRVVADADLDTEARTLARALAAGPSVALGHLRANVRRAHRTTLPEQIALERAATVECGDTHDFVEALAAFAERRHPTFGGH